MSQTLDVLWYLFVTHIAVMKSLYNKSPSAAMCINNTSNLNGFKQIPEFANVTSLFPSLFNIFLEQTKTNVLKGFIGTIAVGG